MIRAYARRGLASGLLAGLVAGLVGFLVGTPTIDAAEQIAHADAAEAGQHGEIGHAADTEQHAETEHHGETDHHGAAGGGADAAEAGHDDGQAEGHGAEGSHGQGAVFTRQQQSVGLVLGTGLAGVVLGLVFAVAAVWAAGRVRGDAWLRSLKLGAVALAVLVGLPLLAYPPTPPGAGNPDTVALRAGLFVATVAGGVALAIAGRWLARRLAAAEVLPALRQTLTAVVVLAAGALLLLALPAPADVGAAAGDMPAELVWRFRLGTLATQSTLILGTAVVFGVLSARAEARQARGPAAPRDRGARPHGPAAGGVPAGGAL